MKAAAIALLCVLRLAVAAQAAEFVRPISANPAQSAVPLAVMPSPVQPPQARPQKFIGDHSVPAGPKPATGQAVKEPPRTEAGRRPRVCLGPAETRATVAEHRLTEPFRALRAGGQQGEALRAKLCRWTKDEFVYEISVLRRDGRILHLYMNAQSGQAVGALDDNDRH